MKKKDTLFCLVEKYDNHFDQSICLELLIPDISQYSFQTNILNSSSWTPLDGAFNVICEIFSCQKSKEVFVALCKNILRIFQLAKKYQVRSQLFTKPNIGTIWLKDWKMDNGPGPAFCLAPLRSLPSQAPPPTPSICPWSQILRALARNVTVCAADIITPIVILLLVNILYCPEILN